MPKIINTNLKKLPLGSIKPTGWLLDEILLISNLQKRLGSMHGLLNNGVWDNGDMLPRYVRGLTLLAAVLDDKSLKDKAASFLLPIFNSATGSGDFGPKGYRNYETKIEAIKAILDYRELTDDERSFAFLKRFFKNQYNNFSVTPYWFNSRARLLDEIPAIEAVYRESDSEWLIDLAEKLRDCSNDWFKYAVKFKYKKPTSKYLSQARIRTLKKMDASYDKEDESKTNKKLKPFTTAFADSKWHSKKHQLFVETNGTNIAKAIKYPAVYGRLIGDDNLKDLSLKMIRAILKNHGNIFGLFNANPFIAGKSSSSGIDVLTACEMVESLVEVVKETQNYGCVDILERIVYNFIPGAMSEDALAIQDLALINQIESSNKRKIPYASSDNAYYTKKLSPGALAMLSVYPLYMQTACMLKGDEVNFLSYMPCNMTVFVGGVKLVINEKTGYPFRNSIIFKVEEATSDVEVKMNFRVPGNTTMSLISGGSIVASGTKEISVKCVLKTGSTFMLKLDIPLTIEENIDNSYSITKGNVIMTTKIPYEATADEQDRRVINVVSSKKWNVAPLISRHTSGGVKKLYDDEVTTVHDFQKMPFSFENPPFELKIRCKNILNWDYDVNGFSQLPEKPTVSEESLERVFIPYGCSLLHIAHYPKCSR